LALAGCASEVVEVTGECCDGARELCPVDRWLLGVEGALTDVGGGFEAPASARVRMVAISAGANRTEMVTSSRCGFAAGCGSPQPG